MPALPDHDGGQLFVHLKQMARKFVKCTLKDGERWSQWKHKPRNIPCPWAHFNLSSQCFYVGSPSIVKASCLDGEIAWWKMKRKNPSGISMLMVHPWNEFIMATHVPPPPFIVVLYMPFWFRFQALVWHLLEKMRKLGHQGKKGVKGKVYISSLSYGRPMNLFALESIKRSF